MAPLGTLSSTKALEDGVWVGWADCPQVHGSEAGLPAASPRRWVVASASKSILLFRKEGPGVCEGHFAVFSWAAGGHYFTYFNPERHMHRKLSGTVDLGQNCLRGRKVPLACSPPAQKPDSNGTILTMS